MELFRINGLSSEDIMRQGRDSASKQFHGTMFRMGDHTPRPAQDLKAPAGDAAPSAPIRKSFRKADGTVGAPVAAAPAPGEEEAALEALGEGEVELEGEETPAPTEEGEGERYSPSKLGAMKKEALVALGASLGVADLSGTKEKLIELILAAQ